MLFAKLKCCVVLFVLFIFIQCAKQEQRTDRPIIMETDSALFAKITAQEGFHYYQNSDRMLLSSSASAHNKFFRVRFNEKALAALSDNGKLPAGGSFPAGSLIVKELRSGNAGEILNGYAVMEKLPDDTNAGAQWIWAEYFSTSQPNGVALHEKGRQCISCHSTGDRDKVRLFTLFP